MVLVPRKGSVEADKTSISIVLPFSPTVKISEFVSEAEENYKLRIYS
jgi:hypothetical protein